MEQREEQSHPLDAHFRCTHEADVWVFEVGTVEWPHPAEPVTVWKPFRRWKREPGGDQLTRARSVAERRFCARCQHCGELQMKGNMLHRTICHGCAQTHLRVCF